MTFSPVAIRQYIIALASFALVGVVLLLPQSVAAESEVVRSFTSTIEVAGDGSFTVNEEIVYDFGDNVRHGIYRTIPVTHPQDSSHWYTKRIITIDNVSVTMDGVSVPVESSKLPGERKLRIGDPEQTVDGKHVYNIAYKVSGGLFYYETENPELYWNVTGSEWEVPIEEVRAVVRGSNGLLSQAQTCYAGAPGASAIESNTCLVTMAEDGVVFATGPVAVGEGVTIAQTLNPSLVAVSKEERLQVVPFALLALFFFVVVCGIWIYRWVTYHKPQNPTIVAQYEPYKDMLPMYTGVLLNGRLDASDITAGIVYLASEGFLKIRKIENKVIFFKLSDYEVELKRAKSEAPTKFHKELLELLFSTDEVGAKVAMKDLQKDTSKQKANFKRLEKLRKALKEDLLARGFFEKNSGLIRYILQVCLVLIAASSLFYLVEWYEYGHLADLLVSWIVVTVISTIFMIVVIASFAARRRTRKGYEAKTHTLGFRDFLTVTDKERFRFHNAPEKSPETFMAYLPYAIALSVEKQWAEVFSDVTIPQPEWYEESGARSFTASNFTSHLGGLASAMAASAVAQSNSASSGGGFSGGGAGGGGGGSW